MNTDRNTKKEHNNGLYTLLYAFKMLFNNWCKKIANRMTCTHESWEDVYCLDTELFMYKRCKNCGKKSCRP